MPHYMIAECLVCPWPRVVEHPHMQLAFESQDKIGRDREMRIFHETYGESMRAIARKYGVAHATVQRAICGRAKLSDDQRERKRITQCERRAQKRARGVLRSRRAS